MTFPSMWCPYHLPRRTRAGQIRASGREKQIALSDFVYLDTGMILAIRAIYEFQLVNATVIFISVTSLLMPYSAKKTFFRLFPLVPERKRIKKM